MEKPDVDSIDGLSPAISIEQKTTSRNPRSTVGTVTEIYDYLRLLYARIGHPHCPSLRRAHRAASRPSRSSTRCWRWPRARASRSSRRWCAGARASSARSSTLAAGRGLLARQGRRRDVPHRRRAGARQEAQARHLGGRRPARHEGRPAPPAHRLRRDGALRWPRGSSRSSPVDGKPQLYSERFACAVHGVSLPELAPRVLLVQLAARRVPELHRARAPRSRSTPTWSCPTPRSRSPRARSRRGTWAARATTSRSSTRSPTAGRSISTSRGASSASVHRNALPQRHRRRARLRHVQEPQRAQALVHGRVRGDRAQPRAPLPRDDSAAAARAHRGVHVDAALRGLRRGAPQAGVAGRRPGRASTSTRSRAARCARRARSCAGLELSETRAADRRARDPRDRRAAGLPRRRRASGT